MDVLSPDGLTCLESNLFITDAFHEDCGHSNLTHQCNRSSETQIYGTRFRYTKLIQLGSNKLSQGPPGVTGRDLTGRGR